MPFWYRVFACQYCRKIIEYRHMSDLKILTDKILAFINERDWGQFMKPKDIAISLSLEASEVLEKFQWKNEEEFKKYLQLHKEDLADELADVLVYLIELAHYTDINLLEATEKKIVKNAVKYPVEKARGKNTKYTDL